ncbi:MAG TPA: serine hydrolase domain-containing protein, partial [Longimicrobium sp.]|nr:serine hydrolase domain-containing protein [Longimicrobium sp.]
MNRPIPLFCAALLAAFPAAAPAQTSAPAVPAFDFPSGAAGTLVRAAVTAVNDADSAAVDRFAAGTVSPRARHGAEVRELLHALRRQGGTFRPGATDPWAGGRIVQELWSERVGNGAAVLVTPDPQDTTRLLDLQFLKTLRPAAVVRELPRVRLADAALTAAIAGEVERLAAADEFSGVVLVARGGDVLYEAAFGTADPATGARITPATRFNLASLPKMWTAVAIGQLVESGRLSLDATIGEVLPEQPWTAQARGVTIAQLLSHVGGFGMLFDRPGYERAPGYRTSTELLRYFAAEPLRRAPGTRWAYSNEGFEVLGAVVEKLGGTTFAAYLDEHLLRPAGMESAWIAPPADTVTHRAVPLPVQEGDYLGTRPRVARRLGVVGSGAGGAHGTARDVFRFARALATGRLVSRATRDTFTAARQPLAADFGADYAYGFWTRRENGRTVLS